MSSFWYPEGTQITPNSDGSLTFDAPTGWVYVGIDVNGNPILPALAATKTTVSCDCKSPNSWCNPFWFKGTGGCLGKCADCRMSTKLTDIGTEVQMGGYINTSIPATILGDNYNSVPECNAAILEIPEVQTIITNFVNATYPSGQMPNLIFNLLRQQIEAPSNHLIGLVNIAGRAVPFPLPLALSNGYCGTAASCDCGCDMEEKSIILIGTIYQCKDTCQGKCTMTIYDVAQYDQLEVKNIARAYLH